MALKTKDLNRADAETLMEAGLTEERAFRLMEYRDENGEFELWEEVRSIPGFTEDMVNKLRNAGFTIEHGNAGTQKSEFEYDE